MADLSPGQVQAVYAAVMLSLLLAIVFYCRRPGSEMLPRQWGNEIALMLLATLWFSPLVWSYHPTAALPALAMIYVRAPRHPKLTWVVTLLWMASLGLMGLADGPNVGRHPLDEPLAGRVSRLDGPRRASHAGRGGERLGSDRGRITDGAGSVLGVEMRATGAFCANTLGRALFARTPEPG